MIKPNELRVGNFVQDRGGKVLRIDYFENNKICQEMPKIGPFPVRPLTEEFEYLQPVPLTNGLLDKIDITKNEEGSYHILWDKVMMYKVSANDWRIELTEIGCFRIISSLHELQNVWYGIHGEELSFRP